MKNSFALSLLALTLGLTACIKSQTDIGQDQDKLLDEKKPISEPLVRDLYTADPSARVFNGRIYIYPSHDIESGVKENDKGDHFDMRDYHVYSMATPDDNIKDHGVAIDIKDIVWAGKQLWAPDAAYTNGSYYLYFPAKDKQGIFRIGVARSASPTGPFEAEASPMKNSYSIDPCVFKDDDGKHYMYFGGIWGGQLQHWRSGEYDSTASEPAAHEMAMGPRVALIGESMTEFAESPKEVIIKDEAGKPLLSGDNKRRFFEAAWMHKYKGKYYLSYSTGDTHFICYAIGDSPYGPFTYKGVVLNPVLGWTNHHSIVEFNGKWYLYYHDSTLSGGKTHLRNIKVTEITYDADGKINTIDPYIE